MLYKFSLTAPNGASLSGPWAENGMKALNEFLSAMEQWKITDDIDENLIAYFAGKAMAFLSMRNDINECQENFIVGDREEGATEAWSIEAKRTNV